MTAVLPIKKIPGALQEFEPGDRLPTSIIFEGIETGFLNPCTAGGTANAITLTSNYTPTEAYAFGCRWWAYISNTNTGATTVNVDGLGVKTAVTVTGVALPAGYIRTDVPTKMWYDPVNDRIVVDREPERGSNANGTFVRYADGFQRCIITGVTLSTSSPGFSNTLPGYNWIYPAAFVSTPYTTVSPSAATADNPTDFRSNYIPMCFGLNPTNGNLAARIIAGHTALNGEWTNARGLAEGFYY